MYMERMVNIGLLQFKAKLGDVKYNVEHAVEMIEKAAKGGAQIVCLPELFATGYNLQILEEKTLTLGFEYFEYIKEEMSKAAKMNQVYVIAPTVEIRDMAQIGYNSALMFSDEGELMGSFAKSHVWALEGVYFREGNEYPVFETKYGKVGIMICYDSGFPEACRSLTLNGAEIVFIPSAWRIEDMDMWDLNVPQRALENLLFTVGVNMVSNDENLQLFGKSKVCNPRGTIVKELPMNQESCTVVSIDLNDVRKYRDEIPYLRDRKPGIYGKVTEL